MSLSLATSSSRRASRRDCTIRRIRGSRVAQSARWIRYGPVSTATGDDDNLRQVYVYCPLRNQGPEHRADIGFLVGGHYPYRACDGHGIVLLRHNKLESWRADPSRMPPSTPFQRDEEVCPVETNLRLPDSSHTGPWRWGVGESQLRQMAGTLKKRFQAPPGVTLPELAARRKLKSMKL